MFALLLLHCVLYITLNGEPSVVTNWFQEDELFELCCSIVPQVNEALVLSIGRYRIQTLIKNPATSSVVRYEGNQKDFLSENTGWNVYPLDKPGEQLCVYKITGASIRHDDQMTFVCNTIKNMGLGAISKEERIQIRIFRPVRIIDQTDTIGVAENSTALLFCHASGFPDLQLYWRSKTSGNILNQTEPNATVTETELQLILPSVEKKQHGQLFECEARTSYPADIYPVKGISKLEVYLPPKINITSRIIHTDLGARESVEILVTGYPIPELICDGLHLTEPRQVSKQQVGGTFAYTAVIDNITKAHLTTFHCEASNELGITNETIEFTTAPSEPVILSPSQTELANYYMLNWKVRSRAPLKNVTVEIEEFTSSNISNPMVPRSPRMRKIVYPLNPDNANDVRTSVWAPSGQAEGSVSNQGRWEHVVWHHVANLSEDTEHGISLKVCNEHACRSSKVDPASRRPTSVAFRTARFSGSNNVDHVVLSQPPMDAAKAKNQPAVLRLMSSPDGAHSIHFSWFTSVASFVVIAWIGQLILY
ncbi:Vesicular amine transporter [Paragonimus heterotremus]|uniref:Vesicular amine transporter n=1 Tax=Paragonimus heterotremus TaxID=100268 RepID=A0A8J4SZC2_9TREM|nr:Vesicular amine transporter [Paragonimus heterotremus]